MPTGLGWPSSGGGNSRHGLAIIATHLATGTRSGSESQLRTHPTSSAPAVSPSCPQLQPTFVRGVCVASDREVAVQVVLSIWPILVSFQSASQPSTRPTDWALIF